MREEREAAFEDIRHRFEPAFYFRQGGLVQLRLAHFIRNIVVTEPEPNGFKADGSLLCYSSIHKSQLDYVLLGFQLAKSGYPSPRYIAGKNLFIPSISRDYLKKAGAICLDRERVMRRDRVYIRTFAEYLRDDVLGSGEHLLFFPEGGRSYTGQIGKPATGIYDTILETAARSDRRILVVPIALTYEGVVEAASFPILLRSRKLKRMWQKKLLYYVVDMGQILAQYFRDVRVCGDAYIDVLPPLDVSAYVGDRRGKVHLARDALAAQRSGARISRRSLLASAMGDDGHARSADVVARLADLLDEIRDRALPVTRIVSPFLEPGVDRQRVLRSLLKTANRLVIERGDTLRAPRPAVLEYYRNTTAHHFEAATRS